MKQQKLPVLLFFIMIFGLSACKIQAPIISSPTDYKVEKFNLKEVKLKIWLPIENPNKLKFNISKVDLDIYINGTKLGKVTKLEKVKIPAKSKDIYAVKLHVETKDLGVSAMAALAHLSSRHVLLKLDGSITVSKFVIVKKIEVESEESIKIF